MIQTGGLHLHHRSTPRHLLIALALTLLPILLGGGASLLWSTPLLLLAALEVSWGAEVMRFLIAQGLALALLAWLQTLPEFAVEAVLAWRGQVQLLMAGLTGAIRLLVGLGWPLIFFIASAYQRRRRGGDAGEVGVLSIPARYTREILGLAAPLIYAVSIGLRRALTTIDSIVLFGLYGIYLWALQRHPTPGEPTGELEAVPAYILASPPKRRTLLLTALFLSGGVLLYLTPKPFLDGLLAAAVAVGIPQFVFVQWIAPLVSEFPEKISAFYWARRPDEAPLALMNMVSSNVNQWTVLVGMLPIVYAASPHANWLGRIPFDSQQQLEWWLTVAQSFAGIVLLARMRIRISHAIVMFALWFAQFATSPVSPAIADRVRIGTTLAYCVWGVWLLFSGGGVKLFLQALSESPKQ